MSLCYCRFSLGHMEKHRHLRLDLPLDAESDAPSTPLKKVFFSPPEQNDGNIHFPCPFLPTTSCSQQRGLLNRLMRLSRPCQPKYYYVLYLTCPRNPKQDLDPSRPISRSTRFATRFEPGPFQLSRNIAAFCCVDQTTLSNSDVTKVTPEAGLLCREPNDWAPIEAVL